MLPDDDDWRLLCVWARDTDTFSSTDSVLQGRGNTHMSLSRGKAQESGQDGKNDSLGYGLN